PVQGGGEWVGAKNIVACHETAAPFFCAIGGAIDRLCSFAAQKEFECDWGASEDTFAEVELRLSARGNHMRKLRPLESRLATYRRGSPDTRRRNGMTRRLPTLSRNWHIRRN
ncbi:hypothetical protein, partial [Bradyrhizobium sp. 151]|uniref:hypothetical protein n=1 Tax=Bradyrhizobium sp. 151 TaxID=2782626 RepID=UPI001FF75685